LTIEGLWQALCSAGEPARQQRIDAIHPLDLYADFEPPGRPGLTLVTSERPRERWFAARSISITIGQRTDGRWTLRMMLEEPRLIGVFAELCRDIIESTRYGVPDARAASTFLDRIDRWRRLLERGPQGLSGAELRGLIGELSVLLRLVLPQMQPIEAISSWTGPLSAAQDFMLPSGLRLEVKAIERHAESVRINGLRQLDAGGDPLKLVAVRVEKTGREAPGAETAARLVEKVKVAIAGDTRAVDEFERLLGFAGWTPSCDGDDLTLRIVAIEEYQIDNTFPRLTTATVPQGILDAEYIIRLPDRTSS
jgi:hypothetical protein